MYGLNEQTVWGIVLEIQQHFINRQKHPPNVWAVNQTIKTAWPRKLGKSNFFPRALMSWVRALNPAIKNSVA